MKRLFILLLVIVPLLLTASPRAFHNPLSKIKLDMPLDLTRAYRIAQKTVAYYMDNSWSDSERTIYYYNSVRPTQVDSLKTFAYDTETMEWTEQMTAIISYKPGGTYVDNMLMGFSYMGMFFPMFMTQAYYDDQDRLIHYNMYAQPFGAKEWMPMNRMHIVYNSTTDYYVCSWDMPDEEGVPAYHRTNFEWDAQGRIITENEQASVDSVTWVNSYRSERIWHPHDTTTGGYFIEYISKYLPLMVTLEDDFAFPGMESQLTSYYWDNAWIPDNRDTYEYNATDKLISKLYEYMNMGEWENSEFLEYNWDNNGNLWQITTSYWEQGVRTWVYDQRQTNTWDTYTSTSDPAAPAIAPLTLKVYPQPFKGDLKIVPTSKTATPVNLQIFNTRGQMVHSTFSAPNAIYDWHSDLPSGIYFLKAESDGYQTFKKVISIK